ncbi:MAG: hypothetical protein KME60_03705 [Cyanomargarita calcarea GSE-NOS-MK-12-04C]|jgi:hypothetical protein|uniref:ABC transmembrane type-1 domain-containing protein n=1 Tax=Cyanomargarita calcarea GSE-NOS-MK-12-04C TaxID=2839659 RepID=A0A951UT99_9CYAN|nr:hypothetical protein [Cyanomargarita calcarea GSE-NOS-MK-12-04C]
MRHILASPELGDFFTSLAIGDINLVTGLVWLVIATLLSMVGGAIGGILLAKNDLGYQLSALLGGFLGPAGVLPAMILGLIILTLLRNY